MLLPIDAHYKPLWRTSTARWGNSIQTYDATFSLQPTDELVLHSASVPYTVASQPGIPVFDDRTTHYDPVSRFNSVIHPNTGTQIRIQSISALDSFMQIEVRPVK